MLKHLTPISRGRSVPIVPVAATELTSWLKAQTAALRRWVTATGFVARRGEICLITGPTGALDHVLLGAGDGDGGPWTWGGLPMALPTGTYRIAGRPRAGDATTAALGWALGGYHFGRYRKTKGPRAVLVWPKGADRPAVERAAAATTMTRDLINTPAADMGPAELAAVARQLARRHGAKIKVIVGDDLLRRRYPAIHAVGRASNRAPRLIDVTWGRPKAPLVTLVGKGVCFDSGGLDLKSASGMKLMKKDMGGAANVLGLAHMIMAAKLKLRLRVLIPAVENSVSGNALRPLDVITTRQGLTVEIGNTDAEGRVILADALTEASTDKPQLLIDFATLTGAAKVALGTDLPAYFCNNERTATDLARFGDAVCDPLWRLPLWAPYRSQIESRVADINNTPAGGYGGAITAALFLAEFVDPAITWVHVDLMAWNLKSSPGRPEGGEAQGMRAMFELIRKVAGG